MKRCSKYFYVLLTVLLLITAFHSPIYAADNAQLTIIPLAYGQVQSGSFSANESSSVYYAITITKKQAITIYGTQTEGKYVSLSLYDEDMNYVTHQSTISKDENFRWRTSNLSPGKYYIRASSHYSAIKYTIAYASSPYPNATSLARAQKVSGKVTSSHKENFYKIVLTRPSTITFTCTKEEGPYLCLCLYDENGSSVEHMSVLREDSTFSWTPKNLSSGTYYLEVSRHMYDVNYRISWTIKGPDAVTDLRSSKRKTNMVTLKWTRASKASKYIVSIYNSKKKTYKTYKTVTSSTCTVKKLKAGTKYKFKIVPVMKYGSEQIKGDEKILKVATAPKKAKRPTIKFHHSGTIYGTPVNYYVIKWKKVKGATGYEVYGKTKGSSKWETFTTKSKSDMLYVAKGFTAQIKVRAYTVNNGVYSYGAFSKVKIVKSK